MAYLVATKTDPGGRPTNQDRVSHSERDGCLIMVLADGLGGYLRGEMAAEVFVDTVIEEFNSLASPATTDPNLFLATVTMYTNIKLNRQSQTLGIVKKTPRTTGTICFIQNDQAYWAHVGDSRIYHFRDNKLVNRTRDHTLTDIGQAKGHLKMTSKKLNDRLLSSIGGKRRPHMSLSDGISLQQNDIIAACSDGVWKAFDTPQLATYLDNAQLANGVDVLVADCREKMGKRGDNMSIIATRWTGQSSDRKSSHQITAADAINQERLWQKIKSGWDKADKPTPNSNKIEAKKAAPAKINQTLEELENLIDEIDKIL